MKRLLVLIVVLLLVRSELLAQSYVDTGDWFMVYNAKHRQKRGNKYVIHLSRVGTRYMLTHKDPLYSASLPPEGAYELNNSGNLVQGKLVLYPGNKIIRCNTSSQIELLFMPYYLHSLDSFAAASYMIDQFAGDSLKTKPKSLLTKSIQLTKDILTVNTKCIECYYNLAIAWYYVGNMDSSIEAFRMMKELDSSYEGISKLSPSYADYYNRNGWETYGKKSKYKEAVLEFKKGLAFDPNNVDLWYNMGGAYYSDDQFAKAIACFKKCLTLDPDNEGAHEGLQAATAKTARKK